MHTKEIPHVQGQRGKEARGSARIVVALNCMLLFQLFNINYLILVEFIYIKPYKYSIYYLKDFILLFTYLCNRNI